MTLTNRILFAMSFLGFVACGADKVTGTGGSGGGMGGAGAAGMAGGGHGGGGTSGGGESGHGGGGAGGTSAGGHGGGGAGGTSAGGASGGGAGGTSSGGVGGHGGQAGCAFSATYTINDGGGIAAFERRTVLSPPAMFEYDHMLVPNGQTTTCTPALPACGSTKIDVADVEAALANADVLAAFAATTEPFYGERNVADGPSFEVIRSTGGKFVVGVECTIASATCTPTPAGVHALVQLLHDLITQQTADPSCTK